MSNFKEVLRRCIHTLVVVLVTAFACPAANAALTVMDTKYHEDLMFPEFDCYWDGGQYPTLCPTNHKGATVYVYVKNTGAASATISDATLAGYSLADRHQEVHRHVESQRPEQHLLLLGQLRPRTSWLRASRFGGRPIHPPFPPAASRKWPCGCGMFPRRPPSPWAW